MLKRSCAKLGGQLLLPKKSPKPRARVYYAIMIFCETVAYSEGVGVLKRSCAKLGGQLLLPEKSPKPRARVYHAIMIFCETVEYSDGVGVLKRSCAKLGGQLLLPKKSPKRKRCYWGTRTLDERTLTQRPGVHFGQNTKVHEGDVPMDSDNKKRWADSFLTWLPDHPPVASDFSDEYYRAVASAAALQRASGTALFANGVPSPHVIPVVWTQRIALIFYPNPYRSLQLYHVEGDESSGPIGDMGSHGIVLGKVGHPSVMSRDHAVYWLDCIYDYGAHAFPDAQYVHFCLDPRDGIRGRPWYRESVERVNHTDYPDHPVCRVEGTLGASSTVQVSPIKDWLIDSGASMDCVLRKDVASLRFNNALVPIKSHTANGILNMTLKCNMYILQISQHVSPWVLDHTPNLFSRGCRTMLQGWHFFWLGRRRPILVFPSGDRALVLEVTANCPCYIVDKTEVWDIRDPRVKDMTGVECCSDRIVLHLDCPYTRSNPVFKKSESSQPTDKRDKRRLRIWGYSRSRRRRRRAKPSNAPVVPSGMTVIPNVSEASADPVDGPKADSDDSGDSDSDTASSSSSSSSGSDSSSSDSDKAEVQQPVHSDMPSGRVGQPDVPSGMSAAPPPAAPPAVPTDDGPDASRPASSSTDDESICPPCAPDPGGDPPQPRDLRAIAKSCEHCMFHKECNPYCDGCVRGKTRDAPHYSGPRRREVSHFGSAITADIIHMVDADLGTGVGGYKWSLVTRSLFGKGFQGFYPLKSEHTEDVYWAMKHFKSTSMVDLYYTDKAPQFWRSARLLGVPWDHSEPGQPKNNSIAEALGNVSVSTIRACCVTAGFPA